MNEHAPQTLIEAVRHFADLGVCFRYMVQLKWPDGKIVCPKCSGDKVGIVASRSLLQCKDKTCRKQFSGKLGTVFEDSPLGLDKWFPAVWCIANAKNGISSCELARALGVTQKTAWFMLMRIRLAMKAQTFRKLSGEVESDETFVGGKAANMHAARRERVIAGRGPVGKAVVHGLLERGNKEEGIPSQVRADVVPDTEAETLLPKITRNVERGSNVYTDSHASYGGLAARDFWHRWIDHTVRYVAGRVHVNGLENFWSLLKRGLKGTYVAVSPWHLFRYVDEEVFRFNQRLDNDGGRFAHVMRAVLGKRITYRELCGIGGAGFMGIS
jgi:transposase-like protein